MTPPTGPAAEQALRLARAAWPELKVEEAAFLERLEQPGARPEHAAELYLAVACSQGNRKALALLDAQLLSHVASYVSRIDASPAFADEVRQALRERLLLGAGRPMPLIAEYKGSGPLAAWLRVAAVRTALNLRVASTRRQPPREDVAEKAAARDPESQIVKEISRRQFEAALRVALAALSVDERNVLRLHLNERLSIDKIAALHGVHRATAARWLQSARASIFEGTRRCLRERLKLTASELDSLTELVRSQLDVSLQSRLASSRG